MVKRISHLLLGYPLCSCSSSISSSSSNSGLSSTSLLSPLVGLSRSLVKIAEWVQRLKGRESSARAMTRVELAEIKEYWCRKENGAPYFRNPRRRKRSVLVHRVECSLRCLCGVMCGVMYGVCTVHVRCLCGAFLCFVDMGQWDGIEASCILDK